jgi:hypothetical protein
MKPATAGVRLSAGQPGEWQAHEPRPLGRLVVGLLVVRAAAQREPHTLAVELADRDHPPARPRARGADLGRQQPLVVDRSQTSPASTSGSRIPSGSEYEISSGEQLSDAIAVWAVHMLTVWLVTWRTQA